MSEVESLEGKQLLSTMHITHHTAAEPLTLVLDGDLKEPVQQVVLSNGINHSEEKLSGSVQGMGAVHGTSILDYIASTNQLNYAKIVLTNSEGSVTLGYGENAIASQSDLVTKVITRYRFTVQLGTGAYAGASGAGFYTETEVGNGWGSNSVDLKLHTIPFSLTPCAIP
jgi:hypothetical protein